MEYADALQFLESFVNHEAEKTSDYPQAFKLDRMRALARELGNPQNAYECILIAGSKGKGSTAAFLSSILRMENLRVGLYTSPHLVDLRERIRLNGMLISEQRFSELTRKLSKILDTSVWRRDPPTYFELVTSIAFSHFKEMKAHVAVLEVGLGGLYDSTNIAQARVAGITPISLEHTDKLGKTVKKIAVQKCGILKGREIVVSAPQTEDAQGVIEKVAEDKEAELFTVGKELEVLERVYTDTTQKFDLKTPFGNFFDLEIGLLGRHQIQNAAAAVGLAKAFEKKTRAKISEIAVRQGLAAAEWPGRMEKVGDDPKVILDGAHNVDSVKKLFLALKRHFSFQRLIVVFAVSEDKDWKGMLGEIFSETEYVIFTRTKNPRAADPRVLAEAARSLGKNVSVEMSAAAALDEARKMASKEDLILVMGSLFLIGELKSEGVFA